MRSHTLSFACVLSAALAACGGGGNDVTPTLIEGGGIADPGIDGEVNVFVIDERTDEPIEGAAVHVGDQEVETDADGLAVFADVSGPQDVTVVAGGYVTSTWIGVDGANVTMPIAEQDPPTDVPQGTVEGTIAGWDTMAPPAQRALVALVGYSQNHEDGDPANEIATTGETNLCVKLADEACNYQVATRTGQMAIFAYIGDVDAQQNLDLTGFAYATGVVVDDGETVTDVELTVADAGDLVNVDLNPPAAPAGTSRTQLLIEMDLGDDGRLLLPQTDELRVPVPDASLFAGSSYGVLVIADTEDVDQGEGSAAIVRGLSSLGSVDFPELLPLPGAVSSNGETFGFEPVDGATFHVFSIAEADGTEHWNVAILDDTREVELHEHVALPAGELTFTVEAIEIPGLDVRDFELEAAVDTLARVSTADVTFN